MSTFWKFARLRYRNSAREFQQLMERFIIPQRKAQEIDDLRRAFTYTSIHQLGHQLEKEDGTHWQDMDADEALVCKHEFQLEAKRLSKEDLQQVCKSEHIRSF